MSQADAAQRARAVARERGVELNLHSQTLSDYERGKIKKIPLRVIECLAEVYGVTPAFVLSGDESELSRNAFQPNAPKQTPRSARLRIQARIAELTDGNEEQEKRWMRLVERAVEHASAGGVYSPADEVRLIESIGAGIIEDLREQQ